jgi:copper chaperone
MSKETKVLSVKGMSCNHCVDSIKKSVGALQGVYNVQVDLDSKKVTVDYENEKTNIEFIKETIEDQGYEVR